MTVRGALGTLALLAVAAAPWRARAQTVPNAHWRTIDTPHFHVHFTPELEPAARRAAVSAEAAYTSLSARLHPPRGPIDLVIADNVDFSNGSTTPFPTNRIVVYAHPPLDLLSLRFYDDWLGLVITHELTHVFHLDRTRGWWRVAQRVFGRAPVLFPNLYQPSWVTEGLAVYYESDITGAGRVAGTYERMIVESTARSGGVLGIDKWSLATSRYPGGDIAYGYGALFLDYLARTRGRTSIRQYVERSSGTPIPFRLNHMARQGFGITFTRAWRQWRDCIEAAAESARAPIEGWRDVTTDGLLAAFPRWRDNASLVYVALNGKQSRGLYRATRAGATVRLSRRNTADPNALLPDGSVVFSQLEISDPYHVRSDLYREKNGRVTRLTHGARLAEVDSRADGAIIAVRFGSATTRLVRVSADGSTVRPITSAAPDTQWAEPRWSPSGDQLAATRWTRGGFTDIVVLDTAGRTLRSLAHDHASNSQAAWTPDGSRIVYSSDRSGIAQLYSVPVAGGQSAVLSATTTGLFEPDISPDGQSLAAVRWEPDGYHVGIAPLDSVPSRAGERSRNIALDTAPLPLAHSSDGAARDYSPWRSLLPRYWLPLVGQNSHGDYTGGAFTGGNDIVGRHAYAAQALVDFVHAEHTADVAYQYAGLGQPVLRAEVMQYWDRYRVVDSTGAPTGDLLRRTRAVDVGMTLSRPRVRSNAYLTLSGELQMRRYTTDPAPLLTELAGFDDATPHFLSAAASTGWSNAQLPGWAISPEDGVSISATGQLRWLQSGGPLVSKNVSASVAAYRSIDVGSYAHHVFAARVAAGVAGGADPNEFDLGGTSGADIAALPGVSLGSRRTFGVRGFPVGVESGTHIVAASLEYRLPLGKPERGFGLWPVFLDRTSLSVFGDAGSASGGFLAGTLADNWIASVGAELGINLAVPYDVPYLLRIGFAAPVVNHSGLNVSAASVYVRLGFSF